MKTFIPALVLLAAVCVARAEVTFQTVEYKEGTTTCEGVLVHDTAHKGKRPAILVAHQWKGLTDYERRRARMLVELGYVVFCADQIGGLPVHFYAPPIPSPAESDVQLAARFARVPAAIQHGGEIVDIDE